MKTWNDTLRLCLTAIVITGCAIAFMMLTAQNPSADDFWRAMGAGLIGIGSYTFGRSRFGQGT